MPDYEFVAHTDCPPEQQESEDGRLIVYEITMPMSAAPAIGALVPNPFGKGHLKRIASLFNAQAQHVPVPWDSKNPTLRTNINGQDVRMKFVDHPHTDGNVGRAIKRMAHQQGVRDLGGLENAYYSEKQGRMVVDVVSNIPDPLGAIGRSMGTKGPTTTHKVNTPFKRRKK
jgi:hypothetical protein